MLCLPKPSASRGQRSTQNTKTSHAERHENTLVQCAHDKWLRKENWLNNRCVFMGPSLQPLVRLLFEIALDHATFAVQLDKLRHEFRCSWFRNGDVVAKRVDANLADLRPLLREGREQCSVLSPFQEHSMFARAMDHTHTTVGMSRLLSAAAVAGCSSCVMSVTVCSNPSDQRATGESVGCAPSGTKCGLDISAGPVPSCKPNGVLDRTPQCNQVPQRSLSFSGSTGMS